MRLPRLAVFLLWYRLTPPPSDRMSLNRDEQYSQAIDAFLSGEYTKQRECARAYGVDHTVLGRRLRGQQSHHESRQNYRTLSDEQEEALVTWILYIEATGNAPNFL